ncbi:MAG TPA: glycerol-3-phosphate 1-O-acyltransferase PlsY [Caulobacteraceae bacterium]|jgi:glycerol-3-phosphate acyltransferase PlsY
MTDIQPWLAAALVVGGYLLGSIPFGVIATHMAGLGDIRKVGSGNIGATNVLRTGRRDLAAITLIGDGGKGAAAVGLAHLLALSQVPAAEPLACALAGGAAFFGHLFPVWLGFKGGKGVATFLGVLLAAAWPVGVAACLTWLVVAKLLKISSLAALTAAALSPLYALGLQRPWPTVVLAAVLAVLIFIRHHENIRRLLKGAEPRIGAKKAAQAQ